MTAQLTSKRTTRRRVPHQLHAIALGVVATVLTVVFLVAVSGLVAQLT